MILTIRHLPQVGQRATKSKTKENKMANEQVVNINIDQIRLLNPVISAQILNAYYSALLLEQKKGVSLTPDVEKDVMAKVLSMWEKIQLGIESTTRTK
jgi:hypothetical protein